MALKRSLNFIDAYAIGVGAIIGAGIFVILGVAVKEAGPALLVSLVISGIVASFTAFSFAELAHRIPKEGGGYEFAHELVSPFAGYMTGWMWLISNVLAGAVVAIGFAQYLSIVVPLPANIIAALACVCITALNYWGVKESSLLNDGLVIFKIVVLLIFVVLGLSLVDFGNYTNFAPKGSVGVMSGAALIFFAFSGFGRVAMVSEEVKDPEKTVPKAIMAALVSSALIYMLVAFVAVGILGYVALGDSSSPLVDAGSKVGPSIGQLLGIAALAATLSVLLTTLLGISRITYAMSKNGDMPSALVKVHPTRGTPYVAIIVFGAIMTLMALFSSLLFAAAVSNFASLFYYILVNYSAFRMKAPIYPKVLPILGLISCLLLLPFLGLQAWGLGIVATVVIALLFRFRKDRSHNVG